jgi:hypothetical protein
VSLVSKCPKCRQPVTIPDGVDPQASVRCPLCAVVYPLGEALAEAPPALIPVDTQAIPDSAAGSGAMGDSDLIVEPYHVPASPQVQPGPQTETDAEDREVSGLDAPHEPDGAAQDRSPLIDTGLPSPDTYAIEGFSLQESDDDSQPAATVSAKRPRRRKTEKGPLRMLIEVVGGGLLGLTITYDAMCWILGPRQGLPKLPLPLLPHTMHWFDGLGQGDDGQGQPPDAAAEPE